MNDGYVFPIDIIDGLPYVKMRKFTDHEFDSLPHVILTSDAIWDPTQLDFKITDDTEWHSNIPNDQLPNPNFDQFGDYTKRVTAHSTEVDTEILLPMKATERCTLETLVEKPINVDDYT